MHNANQSINRQLGLISAGTYIYPDRVGKNSKKKLKLNCDMLLKVCLKKDSSKNKLIQIGEKRSGCHGDPL